MQIIENQFDLQFTIYDLQLGLLPYHLSLLSLYHLITPSLPFFLLQHLLLLLSGTGNYPHIAHLTEVRSQFYLQ